MAKKPAPQKAAAKKPAPKASAKPMKKAAPKPAAKPSKAKPVSAAAPKLAAPLPLPTHIGTIPPAGEHHHHHSADCCSTEGKKEGCCGQGACACGDDCACGCKSSGIHGCLALTLYAKGSTWLAVVVSILTFIGFDMLWHGHLLMQSYQDSAFLWRPEAAMDVRVIYAAQVLKGLVFGGLFSALAPKGLFNVLRAGLLVSLMMVPGVIMAYATQPIPAHIIQMWALGAVLEGLLAALIISLLGGKKGGCCGTGKEGSSCGCSH